MASIAKILKAKISEVEFEKWGSVFKKIEELLVDEQCEDDFFEIKSEYNILLKSADSDGVSREEIKELRGELFAFLRKWFSAQGKGGQEIHYQASNRVVQVLKKLYFQPPKERVSILNEFFLIKPIRESDIDSFSLDRISKKDKEIIKEAKKIIKELLYHFLSRLCIDIDRPNDFKNAPIERSLQGFYLFWHAIKKVYPKTNFLEDVYECEVFVKLLRYDKSNNSLRVYDCSYQELYKAYFGGLVFKDDSFERCSFYRVDFSKSTLEGVNFKGAAFYTEEMFHDNEMMPENDALTGGFKGTILKNVDFRGALARNVDFSEAKLIRCVLSNLPLSANAEGAAFTNMMCHFSKWNECDFSGADFSGSSFYRSDFKKLTINSKTNFYDVDFKLCHLEFSSENEEDLEVYKSILAKCESLFNSDMHPLLKELLLFELDEASARSVNKALFYSPEELDYWENEVDQNLGEKFILDLPVDKDLYQFKRELEEDLIKALGNVRKRVTFNDITEIKNCVENIEKKLKNFREQRVDEYYYKMLSLSEENIEENELESAFFNLSKIQLPKKFQKRFSSLKNHYDKSKSHKIWVDDMKIVNELRDFVQDLLKDELE